MNRTEIMQRIIDVKKAEDYLEIGVNKGVNFFRIRARRKVAVDPQFCFTQGKRVSRIFRNRTNLCARYYEMTSDAYFAQLQPKVLFDVVFIDGLHTYGQSLRDVLNAFKHLKNNGVIVMHDCNPYNAAVGYPAASLEAAQALDLPGWNGDWYGDVWKTICDLRSNKEDLQIFVLDCDCGLGIITRGQPEGRLNFSAAELARMTYEDLAKDRENLLNLKPESYLSEFLAGL